MNGRQEYHGKGSCGAARHCFKNLNGPEEDLGTSISWNSEDDLDEKRMRAMYHSQLYQKRIARAYNKKIKPGKIREGDLVLKLTRPIMKNLRGKFKPNWEGPYLAKKLFSKGAVIISDLEGNEFREPINMDKLKKYFL